MLALCDADGVTLVELRGDARVHVPFPGCAGLAAFSSCVWAATDDGAIARIGTDGKIRTSLRVAADPDAALVGVPVGPEAALWLGREPALVVEDRGTLATHDPGSADVLVGMGGRRVVRATGSRITLPTGAQFGLGAGRAVGGSALFEGNAVGLVMETPVGRELLVIALASGRAMQTVALPAGIVRLAPRRGLAAVLEEPTRVTLFDLRFGRRLGSIELDAPAIDLAIDADGNQLAAGYAGGAFDLVPVRERLGSMRPLTADDDDDLAQGSAPDLAIPVPQLVVAPSPPPAPPKKAPPIGEAQPTVAHLAFIPPVKALPPAPELCEPPVAQLFLDRALDMVATWCEHAIALAWDRGTLAFGGDSPLPYEAEVNALVRRDAARARPQVERAAARIAEARDLCAYLWMHASVEKRGDSLDIVDSRTSGGDTVRWPFRALSDDFKLSPVACDLLVAAIAPSCRPEFPRLYAILRNDPQRPLCDEMLLHQLLDSQHAPLDIGKELEDGAPLLASGLLRRATGNRIYAAITVNPAVLQRIRNAPDTDVDRLERTGPLWLTTDASAQLSRVLATAPGPLRLLLRGRRSSGRRLLAAMLARATGRAAVDVDTRSVGRREIATWLEARLTRAAILGQLPCISGIDDPDLDGETRGAISHLLRTFVGPIVLRASTTWSPGAELPFATVDLDALSETGRRQVWQHELSATREPPDALVDRLSSTYSVGPGAIVTAASRVTADGDILEVVETSLAEARESRLGTVASHVKRLGRWEDICLPDDVQQRVNELIARIRFRRHVYEDWGFRRVATTSTGITALFSGGPGTGKTLVAGAIARELGYELYRVDVSRISSKWIGETEKNLAQVFDAAEDGRVILLFDEADTLFAKRTEVKSSVDRYANSEVNFLLQRLDTFEGIAILTTNRAGSMDAAFQRRLSMAVTFPEPDEELRERIWSVHIPPEVPRAADLDLASLARKNQFSGGYIRNAVMRALFLAASGGMPLEQSHLVEAVRLEYLSLGKLSQGGAIE
ncbi:MAG TPA: ATP-binding protein [Kofleriaceae bacterium]|jgi:hypothetical protein